MGAVLPGAGSSCLVGTDKNKNEHGISGAQMRQRARRQRAVQRRSLWPNAGVGGTVRWHTVAMTSTMLSEGQHSAEKKKHNVLAAFRQEGGADALQRSVGETAALLKGGWTGYVMAHGETDAPRRGGRATVWGGGKMVTPRGGMGHGTRRLWSIGGRRCNRALWHRY